MQPSDRQIVMKSSAEIFAAKGKIADIFYDRLFEFAPESRAMFHGPMTRQKEMFMASLTMSLRLFGDRSKLLALVEDLGRVHAQRGLKAEHFDLGAKIFDMTIREFFGEACTPELANAWHAAYGELTEIMKRAAAEQQDIGHSAA